MTGSMLDAYRSGGARAFFGGHYADATDRRRAVARAARPLAPTVADALRAQNAGLAASPARDANLALLRDGAAAVVTGQQMGLFLGPLFTLYKAASAISVARALADETGKPVVPVFWLQTEDHDLPEIAACHVPRAQGEPLALRLPASADDRASVAHQTLPGEVDACLAELRSAIAHLPHAPAHLARLAHHYRPGAGWSHAFAGLLADLFADEGLVLIDPRDPVLARGAAAVHRRAITDAEAIAGALLERGQTLAAAGFEPVVHVRPGAPLSFFHPDGATGPRHRLVPASGGFTEVGGTNVHSPTTLLAALDAEPLRFSASALLRPIVQDTLLPTAAYVGGPAEVAYFAQLAPLYARFGMEVPLVVPRASFCILEEKTVRALARLHLRPEDARRPEDDVLAAVSAREESVTGDVRGLAVSFDAALEAVRTRLEAIGPGMPTAIEKTQATVRMALSKLGERADKARSHRDQALVEEVRRLQWALCPGGVPQERVYGLPYFAARYGERAFVERIVEAVVPFDPAPRDLPL